MAGILYRRRNAIAALPPLLLLAALSALTLKTLPKPPGEPPHPPIRIALASLPEPIPAPPAPVPPVPAPPAQPAAAKPQPAPPKPKAAERLAAKAVKPAPSPPLSAPPAPGPSPIANSGPAAAPASAAPAAEASAPAQAARPAASAAPAATTDNSYIGRIRAYLDSIKHYPTSKEARLQRPRGQVEIWFVLDRDGRLEDAGIENSSGSLILDGAALGLVRGASYPAFPEDAFAGQATHRFTVRLDYMLA